FLFFFQFFFFQAEDGIRDATVTGVQTCALPISNGASTVEARIAGFREALFSYGVPLEADSVQRLASITEAELKRLLDSIRPEAFVCVNDRTAGRLMHTALGLGYQVPRGLRIVGID